MERRIFAAIFYESIAAIFWQSASYVVLQFDRYFQKV